jgi:hypothetical protein
VEVFLAEEIAREGVLLKVIRGFEQGGALDGV